MSRKVVFVAILGLFCAKFAIADTVIASGAGPLPSTAQDLTGTNVTEIVGTLSGTNQNDVAMFKINITDFANFSAETVNPGAFGIPDTVLTLFQAGGFGVLANDDISGSNTLSCLPSTTASNPCPATRPSGLGPSANGIYYLAISRSANYPIDGSLNEIFNPSSSTSVVGATLGVGTIAGWDNGAFTSPDFDLVNYDIVLTGTTQPAPAVPEPASWMLMVIGFPVALAASRLRHL